MIPKGRYLLLIATLAGVILIMFLVRDRAPFGRKNTIFSVDVNKITGVDLIQGENKISLRMESGRWMVSGREEARKPAVSFLLNTLGKISVKSPVSAEQFRKEIIEKETEPVRVNIYVRKRVVLSYYVYKTASNPYGNIMKRKIFSKPYIVYLPGYDENIGSHFVVNELYWLPFSVFRLLPSQIKSVKLENFAEPGESFTIRAEGRNFSLFSGTGQEKDFDSLKVRRYIYYFTSVSFESWAYDISENEKAEIRASDPFCIISVSRTDGGETELILRERSVVRDGKTTKDTDRLWGELNDARGLFILRYFDIDPLLKKRSYFTGH